MRHLIDIFLTVWFFTCPIVYSFWLQIRSHLEAHGLTWLYLLNPMTPIVLTTQRVLYAHPRVELIGQTTKTQILPPWQATTYLWWDIGLIGFGIVLTWIGLAIFRRLEGNFAEEL